MASYGNSVTCRKYFCDRQKILSRVNVCCHLLALVWHAILAPELEHGGFEELEVALLLPLQKPHLVFCEKYFLDSLNNFSHLTSGSLLHSHLVALVVVVVAAEVCSLYLYLERHRASKLPQVRPARPVSPGGLFIMVI